jgi:oligopeptide transport system substrate-binding protein
VNPAAALLVAAIALAGCTPSSTPTPRRLAATQVLRLVATEDVGTLDPAKAHQPSVELGLIRNVFGGLYRLDDQLGLQNDLATGKPDVSADGRTWTFHLRKDAVFSNGSPVRANDVVYSWNRLAALTASAYPSSLILEPVVGWQDVQDGRAKTLAGLSASDASTVVAHLTAPAGWWLEELGLWAAAVIDQRSVSDHGEEDWWRTPAGLVGTGPFKLSQWTPGSLDFVPVPHWWRGSTGNLTRIHVDVVGDAAAQLRGYSDNLYDIVGYLPATTGPTISGEALTRFRGSPELTTRPWLRTSFMGFPTAGRIGETAANSSARKALSLALDRSKLATAGCPPLTSCAPATGGLIPQGLSANLGSRNDPNSVFNLPKARTLLQSWDSDGSLRKGLRVGTLQTHQDLAKAVIAEWRDGLGLELQLQIADPPTLRLNATHGLYDITVGGNLADYDSPHNWVDFLGGIQCPYANPTFWTLTKQADAKLPTDALHLYQQAFQLLADDAACPALVYKQGVFLIKPWVSGAGGNALYEFDWRDIAIFDH